MKFTIKEYEKEYIFELSAVAQLCGQNISKKDFIFKSLERYFSNYKYPENNNPFRDNVLIDDEIVGRKYFQVINISKREQIISYINLSKQSLFLQYLNSILQDYNCQTELEAIAELLNSIFVQLNVKIKELGPVKLDYAETEIWDIIQKSDVVGLSDQELDELSNVELISTLMEILEALMKSEPKNYLILFQNLDHYITKEEYKKIYERMEKLSFDYNVKFIISLSLDRYVVTSRENLQDICVYGDENFQFPSYDRFKHSIMNSYPIYQEIDDMQLLECIGNIVQEIGQKKYLTALEDNVICKIINQSLLLNETMEGGQNECLTAFLMS